MIQPSFPELMPESNWRPPDSFPDISGAKYWSLDVESRDPNLQTRGPGFVRNDAFVCGVAIRTDGFSGYYPVRHAQGANLAPNVVFEWLGDQVKHFRGELYGANLLYEEEALWFENVRFNDDVKRRDIQVAEPCIDEETAEGYSLEVLSRKYLGRGKEEDLLKEAAGRYTKGYKDRRGRRPIPFDPKKDLWMLPPECVGAYAEVDVDNPRLIYAKQSKLLDAEDLWQVFELESSLIPILLRMRINGVRVDLERAEELVETLSTEIDRYSLKIKQLVGFDPNVDSGNDMSRAYNALHFAYPELNIAGRLQHTALGNASFTADWYAAQSDPLSRAVLRKKKLMTLRDDFVVGDIIKESVNGRLHCQFQQLRADDSGTRSGRMSSRNPNLQQVPARHDGCDQDCPDECPSHLWGKRDPNWAEEVRKLFVPNEGMTYFKGDYSQQELRLLVHFARRAKMPGTDEIVERYRSNPRTDYHSVVQQLVKDACGKLYKRRYIKDANFGLVYGMGFAKLCRKLGLTDSEAREFLGAYNGAIPFAKSLSTKVMDAAQRCGWVRTLLGRVRHFRLWEPVAESREERQFKFVGLPRQAAEQRWPGRRLQRSGTHKALNSIVQGSAGDQTKEAMRILYYEHGRVLPLQVHDELSGSVNDVEDALLHKRVMEECVVLEIPVVCDGYVGPSWGQAKEEVLAA